jgi:hypothetical protein
VSRRRATGFVITLEFLLVMALFVMPVLIGLFILGRKYLTMYLNEQQTSSHFFSTPVVWDSDAPARAIGPVVGYDAFDAPLVVFRDEATDLGVILGVRRDRFTSYGQVFYTDDLCTDNPRIRAANAPNATGGNAYPPNGYAYQLQGRSYAMGNGNILYSSNAGGGPAVVSNGNDLFVWISQSIDDPVPGPPTPPCYAVPNGTIIASLVPAIDTIPVIDFDAVGNYVPYFQLAFPTPSAAPPLPAGE